MVVVVVGCPMPVPLNCSVAGMMLKLLEMVTPPFLDPDAVGTKLIDTVQLAEGGRGEDETQSSISAKSLVALIPITDMGELLVFESVICCGALPLPTF
jgi:hypothetical protein